jgi:hypothetical protein
MPNHPSTVGLRAGAALLLILLTASVPGAEAPYWALIVHGGNTTHASYDKGVLRVEFRHSRHPAGDSLHYERQVPSGQAAWPDRPLSAEEPSVLFQRMPPDAAAQAIEQLDGRGYWRFYCRNTGNGYFEVLKSGPVSASIRFD